MQRWTFSTQLQSQEDSYKKQNENPEAHYQTCKWDGNMRLGEYKQPTSIKPANKALCQHTFHLNPPN